MQNCRDLGATVVIFGAHIGEAREHALGIGREQCLTYVHGFDDPHVIAGAGTLGIEIVEQCPSVDAVVIPVGGAGLIAGASLAIKTLRPDVLVVGAEPQSVPSFAAALEALDALEELTHALEHGEGIDEAYEHAAEELGDVVFQVVFHAYLASEEGRFDLTDVLDGVRTKLISRHPHVFADVVAETPDEVAANWEDLKRAEKGRASVTEGIPAALPALVRFTKLRRKANAVGLAEPEFSSAIDSAINALEQLRNFEGLRRDDAEGSSSGPEADLIGDVLAEIVDGARRLGVDPEMALRHRADRLQAEIIAAEIA